MLKVLLFQKVPILFSTLCAHLSFLRCKWIMLVGSQWLSAIPFSVIKYPLYKCSYLSHGWLLAVKFVSVRIQARSWIPYCIGLTEYIYFWSNLDSPEWMKSSHLFSLAWLLPIWSQLKLTAIVLFFFVVFKHILLTYWLFSGCRQEEDWFELLSLPLPTCTVLKLCVYQLPLKWKENTVNWRITLKYITAKKLSQIQIFS